MRFDASATAFEPTGRLRLVQPRRQFERATASSRTVSGAARAEAREISSPKPCHRPAVKERLEKLLLIDRQKQRFTHYVEIPAVQSQQQSPSVENANKKKVHMYAYTS